MPAIGTVGTGSCPKPASFTLAFMAGARSGWVKSTPVSRIATVMPLPVTLRSFQAWAVLLSLAESFRKKWSGRLS